MRFVKNIYHFIRFKGKQVKWRTRNKNNQTILVHDVDIDSVKVGDYSYGPLNVIQAKLGQKLVIGNFCSIAENVTFLLNADHRMDLLSTYPFRVKCGLQHNGESISKGDIIVDDDVWIGYGAMIMSGVHIGRGAVIAAGAVVVKDVSPYSIVGGVPGKEIKKRFNEEVIEKLMKVEYSKLSYKKIIGHLDEMYTPIDEKNVEELIRAINE